MKNYKGIRLLHKYLYGKSTFEDKAKVEKWYEQIDESKTIGDAHELLQLKEKIYQRTWDKLKPGARVIPFYKKTFFRVAAAVIVLALGFSTYYLLFNKPVKSPQVVIATGPDDVPAPQSSKAMVTLANGQRVFLDSISNGALALQGNVKLVKLPSGEIVYQQSGELSGQLQYNTLENPRGSKVINMALADGSKVWLNAGSSLTYPIAFVGSERKVSVTGEAYFEVAHDASKPFVVHNGAMDVQVLGTHFNVNAFEDDDNNIKVTLLEGSVKITNGNSNGLLKPGQQALVSKEVKIVNDVDLNKVMAWKNGYFQFDKASLQSVLKQVARWYDVEVIYEGKNQPRQFVGEIQRDLSLSEVLRILEINKVHFTLEGKKLIVKPD